jgi:hypothetical protein
MWGHMISTRSYRKTLGRTVGLAIVTAFTAVPAAAQAAPVDLGTAAPFAALGGAAVTNSGGTSALHGDLGVSPGTVLFMGAAQAQSDLTDAYNSARDTVPSTDKSGQNLGGQVLPAGAYKYSANAQLTGTLTLDAAGDPNAQFVFQIGSQLTTAADSRVVLVNGASACNVYWQIGATAVVGGKTDFQGTLMANDSITMASLASVRGRTLVRTGNVSLTHNVVDASPCGPGAGNPPFISPVGTPATTPAPGTLRPFKRTRRSTSRGTARMRRLRSGSHGSSCGARFRARVRGRMIKRVTFRLDGKRISSRRRSPFRVSVKAAPGRHRVSARVSFTDATRARTLTLPYRACS